MSNYNYVIILLAIIIIVNSFLGFIVLIADQGWKKKENVNFFTFALFYIIWLIANLLMFINVHSQYDLFWTRSTYFTGVIAAYFWLRFVIAFPKTEVRNQLILKIVNIGALILTIISALSTILPDAVTSVTYSNDVRSPVYGNQFTIWEITLVIIVVLILIFTVVNYLKSSSVERIKARFMMIGIISTLALIIFEDVISPLFMGNNYLSNFDCLSFILFFGFTAYAIIKHQLFNIKVILTETAVGLVALVSLTQILLSNDNTQKIIGGSVFILIVYGGYLIIKSVLDEIKQKEQLQVLSTQLGEANLHLKDLDKMKTEFVSLASHELLTPVSAIEGYLSMMLDEKLVKIDDPKAILYMDRVYRSAKRLARLIADMLNISRIEEGRLSVEKQDVDLVETINQVLEELKFKAEEHKQKMVFENDKFPISNVQSNSNVQNSNDQKNPDSKLPTPNSSPFMTYADPDKVKEILVNIIGNSIKYTLEPGTIHISLEKVPTAKLNETWGKLEQEIMARPVDDQESIHAVSDEFMKQIVGSEQYLIKVKDEGVGIPKEELPRLFKKFHRVGNYSTQESQGTGLGLYITRALVELHHGRVWPDSEGMGKGSTFTFSLPTIEAKQAIIDLEAQSPQDKEKLKPLAKPMGNDDTL